MSENLDRTNALLFDKETTMKTDYKYIKVPYHERTKYIAKPVRSRPITALKDVHALTEYKVPNVPFNLFWEPKVIVRTHPLVVQKPYYREEDEQKEEVRKTRPRVFMTPAVSLDDAEDKCREILVKDTYTTETRRALETTREMVDRGKVDVRAPLPLRASPPGLLKLPRYQPPLVSPEWRMDSVRWDSTAVRTGLDITPGFWLSKSWST